MPEAMRLISRQIPVRHAPGSSANSAENRAYCWKNMQARHKRAALEA
jgi:hypothetical protein